jgi:hypothetical protein
MPIYELDPITDIRWPELLQRDARGSIFHTRGWLQALQKTYGYQPIALTTSSPGQPLANGLVICSVNSWVTGKRLVSLPFSDHCEPLGDVAGSFEEMISYLQQLTKEGSFKYFELRPRSPLSQSTERLFQSEAYAFHVIDLRPSEDELYQAFHKDSIRRKVTRAQKEGLTYAIGSTETLLRDFYQLFVMTRKRHGVPPSPFRWFRNLIDCAGENAEIRIAAKDGVPVAGLFTLKHNRAIVYKYGASDERFSNLGGTPFLFWQAILESKAEGLEEMDLGRSDLDNEGLIVFKNRLGGTRSDISYWRLPIKSAKAGSSLPGLEIAKKVFAVVPDSVRIGLGNLLYKHLG